MANGGRGLMLIDLEAKDTLAGAAAYTRSIRIDGIGRGGKQHDETLEIRSLNNARAARGRKGKAADFGLQAEPDYALESDEEQPEEPAAWQCLLVLLNSFRCRKWLRTGQRRSSCARRSLARLLANLSVI